MAQISKGDTFTDGEQVTGARLNQLVDSATLSVGAILDQGAMTANTVAATDSVLLYDLSATGLRKPTVSDVLNSNLPISTSSITGGAGVDIVVTPAATRKFDVAGAFEAESANVVGAATIGGNASVTGTFLVTGGSTLTGNVIADNGFTSNGIANFTGTLQVNGTVGYVLTEIVEETMSYSGTLTSGVWTSAFTSASYTKPANEIWIIETDFRFRQEVAYYIAIRLQQTTPSTTLNGLYNIEGAGSNYFHVENGFFRYCIPSATTFTTTFTFDFQPSTSGVVVTLGETTFPYAGIFTDASFPASKFRIYKYKTA